MCPRSHLFFPGMGLQPVKCLAAPHKPCHVCNCKTRVITDMFASLTSWMISTEPWRKQGLYKTFTNAPWTVLVCSWSEGAGTCQRAERKIQAAFIPGTGKNPNSSPLCKSSNTIYQITCKYMANLWYYQEENLISGECCCRQEEPPWAGEIQLHHHLLSAAGKVVPESAQAAQAPSLSKQ